GRACGGARERRAVLPHRGPGDHGSLLWRVGAATARDLPAGTAAGAVDRLHRRDRLDRAQARGGHGRSRAPGGRAAAHTAARPRAAAARNRERRDEPDRRCRRGAPSSRPLRPPGRFDREIIIGVPDVTGRREILAIHTRGMPLDEDVDLDELARISYGYVGADMAALAREAAMETLRRFLPEMDLESGQIDP